MQKINSDIIKQLKSVKYGIEGHTLVHLKGGYKGIFELIRKEYQDTRSSKDKFLTQELELKISRRFLQIEMLWQQFTQIAIKLRENKELTDDFVICHCQKIKSKVLLYVKHLEIVRREIILYNKLSYKSDFQDEMNDILENSTKGLENNKKLIFKQLERAKSILEEIKYSKPKT